MSQPPPPRRGVPQRLRLAWARGVDACAGPAATACARLHLWLWGASVEGGLSVRGRLRLHVSGALRLGRGVRINSGARNFVGIDRRMSIWVGREGVVEIGDGCGLSNSTICCARSVRILAGTLIGGGCDIYDTDFHPLDAAGRSDPAAAVPAAEVVIGPRAFVGAHVKVLKGVTIGEGAVIGAGSVVTRSVPPGEIWAGVPARFVRKLPGAEGARP